jgi:hypothetical protein
MEASNLEQLLTACEEIAKTSCDGHLTIYRFTTGWKVILGTPEMSIPEQYLLSDLIPGKMSLPEALKSFLHNPVDPETIARETPEVAERIMAEWQEAALRELDEQP